MEMHFYYHKLYTMLQCHSMLLGHPKLVALRAAIEKDLGNVMLPGEFEKQHGPAKVPLVDPDDPFPSDPTEPADVAAPAFPLDAVPNQTDTTAVPAPADRGAN